jgi:hypothetical protein
MLLVVIPFASDSIQYNSAYSCCYIYMETNDDPVGWAVEKLLLWEVPFLVYFIFSVVVLYKMSRAYFISLF